jgi:hypothetical protein
MVSVHNPRLLPAAPFRANLEDAADFYVTRKCQYSQYVFVGKELEIFQLGANRINGNRQRLSCQQSVGRDDLHSLGT